MSDTLEFTNHLLGCTNILKENETILVIGRVDFTINGFSITFRKEVSTD